MPIGSIQDGPSNLVTLSTKASKASPFAYFDPRDANQNGVVSVVEERAYTLKHPELEILERLRTGQGGTSSNFVSYTPKGTQAAQAARGFLDFFA